MWLGCFFKYMLKSVYVFDWLHCQNLGIAYTKTVTIILFIATAVPEWNKNIENTQLSLYETLVWECEATGKPKPSYNWFKNGKPLTSEVRFVLDLDSFEKQHLILDAFIF